MVHDSKFKFSLFYDKTKGIYTTKPSQEISLSRLLEIYRSDKVKDITERIRTADETTKKELKKQLPFITPYGTFEPTRMNVNMTSFNSNLLCLDIDGLRKEEVQLVKFILTSSHSTLLCAVSPRGRGIKAMVIMHDIIDRGYCHKHLQLNKSHIAERLGLSEFVKKIDESQFVPTQPWFIAYDEDLYYNQNCEPLFISLIPYVEPVYIDTPTNFHLLTESEKSPYKVPMDYRIDRYFESAVNGLIKFFACCPEGKRHVNILKVQTISSWIHYAPQLEQQVKSKLLEACCRMYGSEKEATANNVQRSFERAWNNAQEKQNNTIEAILKDPKYSLSRHSL